MHEKKVVIVNRKRSRFKTGDRREEAEEKLGGTQWGLSARGSAM